METKRRAKPILWAREMQKDVHLEYTRILRQYTVQPSTPLSSLRRSSRAAQRALIHLYDIEYQCSYILWVQANDSHSKMHAYRRFITYSLTQTPYLPPMQRHTLEHATRARSAHGASRRPRHGAAIHGASRHQHGACHRENHSLAARHVTHHQRPPARARWLRSRSRRGRRCRRCRRCRRRCCCCHTSSSSSSSSSCCCCSCSCSCCCCCCCCSPAAESTALPAVALPVVVAPPLTVEDRQEEAPPLLP